MTGYPTKPTLPHDSAQRVVTGRLRYSATFHRLKSLECSVRETLVDSCALVGTPNPSVPKVMCSQFDALDAMTHKILVGRYSQVATLGTDVSPGPVSRHHAKRITRNATRAPNYVCRRVGIHCTPLCCAQVLSA